MQPQNSIQNLENPISVYFIRHGESESNVAGMVQGRLDSKLSERGKRQAELLAKWFEKHEKNIGAVYTSPLERAKTTADILAKNLHLAAPQPIAELLELDTGIWTGKSLQEQKERFPELFHQFAERSWEAIPQAESVASLLDRASKLWESLVKYANAGNKTMLCVSHSGFMQWIFKSTFHPTPQHWIPLLRITNCALFHFSCTPDRRTNNSTTAEWSLINYPIPELATV